VSGDKLTSSAFVGRQHIKECTHASAGKDDAAMVSVGFNEIVYARACEQVLKM